MRLGRSRRPPSGGRSPGPQHGSGFAGYDLRHSYGTALYRVAGDTRLVKDVLGHSDVRTTERYTLGHVPEAMRSATSRFEEHLGVSSVAEAAAKSQQAAQEVSTES